MRGCAIITNLPKTSLVPYYSPACVFLETLLRARNIPFKVSQCSIWNILPREHLYPIITVDGYTFVDVMEGVDYLLSKFNKTIDGGLLPIERAHAIAISSLLDELAWMLAYSRSRDFSWLRDDRCLMEDFGKLNLYIWRHLIVPRLQEKTRRRVRGYGLFGKRAEDEYVSRTEAMLEALSTLINSKQYFFDVSEPTWLDCKAFAVLIQFKYTPIFKEARLKQFMRERTPNLMTFVTRMKEDFWSDWNAKYD